MLVFKAFISGFGSVFSIGWPKSEENIIPRAQNVLKDDWYRVSKDLKIAIKKYKVEVGNDKK